LVKELASKQVPRQVLACLLQLNSKLNYCPAWVKRSKSCWCTKRKEIVTYIQGRTGIKRYGRRDKKGKKEGTLSYRAHGILLSSIYSQGNI